jgi:mannitol operon transcriptional antiterminator
MKAFLDSRCRQILNFLINQERLAPISEISIAMQNPRRTIYYDLYKINEWLKTVGLNQIALQGAQGVQLDSVQKDHVRQELACLPESTDYILSPVERIDNCVCFMLIPTQVILADHLANLCQVSRNTILNDLKQVKSILKTYQLNLVYEASTGYRVLGETIKNR